MDLRQLLELTDFDWDAGNKAKVLKRMPFEVAESAFVGEPVIFHDDKHSQGEPRWFLMNTVNQRAVALVFTVRDDKIRIVSARYMHKKEVHKYGKKIKK
jgi:uncharacterized DUF497 family protein